MAINVGLENLSKIKIKPCSDLAANRLEINDAIGESIRLYIRNIRFEFTIEDFELFADLFQESLDNMELYFPSALSEYGKNKNDLFNVLKKTYKKISFVENLALIRPFVLKAKRLTRNKLANQVHGGLNELSRPFFYRIISELNASGKLIIIRKFETLPFSFQGGDIDCYYLGDISNLKETFDALNCEVEEQYENSSLSHMHFYRLDQHYDFSISILVIPELFNNNVILNDLLVSELKKTEQGFYILKPVAMVFHLIDSVVSKYDSLAPSYYKFKSNSLIKGFDNDDFMEIEKLIDFAKEEHKSKMLDYYNKLKLEVS